MTDREWDRRLHVRTCGREDEANANYAPYEPTPYAVLQRLADSGCIKRRSRLLDYGCGKGRVAVFMAATVGCRVTGIDQSQKLIDIAVENRRASRTGDRVTLRQALAEQYPVTDEDAFFFFNPFSEKVFEGVLRRLCASCRENPRPMALFCYYPSEAYVAALEAEPMATYADTIDCGDLFNGNDPRERIEIYRLRSEP